MALSGLWQQETRSPDSPVNRQSQASRRPWSRAQPQHASGGPRARTQEGRDGEAEPEWKEMSCLCSLKAQKEFLWEDLGRGGGGRLGTALPRQPEVQLPTESTHLADGPFLPRWTCGTARKDVRTNQSSLRRPLGWKIVTSWVHGSSPSRSHGQCPQPPWPPGPIGFLLLEEHELWSQATQGLSPNSSTQ